MKTGEESGFRTRRTFSTTLRIWTAFCRAGEPREYFKLGSESQVRILYAVQQQQQQGRCLTDGMQQD